MAKSSSCVRSVLRRIKLGAASGRQSDYSLGGCLGQQFGGKLSSDHQSVEVARLATFLSSRWRNGGGGGAEGELHSAPVQQQQQNSAPWLNETPDQRWTNHHQSFRRTAASSSFVLHPLISVPSRSFSFTGNKSKEDDTTAAATTTTTTETTPTTPPDFQTKGAEDVADGVKDWVDTAYHGAKDAATAVQNAYDVITPPIKDFLAANPLIGEISIPIAIFTGAWVVLPRVLRQLHSYVESGSAAILQAQGAESIPFELKVDYNQSVWKAAEDPARLFATLLTLLQVGQIVAPSAAVGVYLTQFWSGGSVLCIVWFLHRWKSNVISRILTGHRVTKEERERISGFDKFSSLALIFIGVLGLAEAAGVAISSLLTVGGVGGIATAFAAREILSNFLTGLTLSISKQFSVGDTIKAGAIEGKVEEVGMISTRLLNLEKKPIMVPNAFFTSQPIINKSRAPWQYFSVKIPIHLNDFERVPSITLEIREMLYRNPHVFLDEDKPQCHIAQFTPTALELAISCNVKPLSKNDTLLVQQTIMVEAARIITTNGARLGEDNA